MLLLPLAGQSTEAAPVFTPEDEAESFMAAMSALGGE